MQSMFSGRKIPYNIRNSENILQVPKPRIEYRSAALGALGLSFETDFHLSYVSLQYPWSPSKMALSYSHQRAPTRQTRKTVF